jgi:Ribbon-helix-helix protein, copG family
MELGLWCKQSLPASVRHTSRHAVLACSALANTGDLSRKMKIWIRGSNRTASCAESTVNCDCSCARCQPPLRCRALCLGGPNCHCVASLGPLPTPLFRTAIAFWRPPQVIDCPGLGIRPRKRAPMCCKTAHPEEGPTVNISASVPSGLVERLDRLAEKQGWNRSAAITEAIRGLPLVRCPARMTA